MRKLVYDEITTQFYQIGSGRVIPVPAPGMNVIGFVSWMIRRRMGLTAKDSMPPMPTRSAGGNLSFTADLKDQSGAVVGTSHVMLIIVTDGRSAFVPGPNPPFFGDIKRIKPPKPVAQAAWQQTLILADGTLQLQGLLEEHSFELFEPAHCAVIGGTGAYVGARGEATVTQVVFPHTARLEISLLD